MLPSPPALPVAPPVFAVAAPAPRVSPSTLRSVLGRAALAAAILMASIGSPGCSDGAQGRTNVLYISIDTLRADHLPFNGYARATAPALSAWAADGTVFRTAYAPRGATWPALTTAHTGKYPIVHGVRTNGDMLRAQHVTTAEHFREVGYRTAAFLSNMASAPHRGFDLKVIARDYIRAQHEWDRTAVTKAEEFLEDHVKNHGSSRFFAWVHLMSPHEPYLPPPPFDRHFEPDYDGPYTGRREEMERIVVDRIDLAPRDLKGLIGFYDGEVLAIDRYVKRLLDALRSLGLEEETLVVFFSDHGEELYDHHYYFWHSASIYESVLRVPLAMRLPGVIPAGKTIDAVVGLEDLLPTVLESQGLPVSSRLDGESLWPLLTGERTERRRKEAFFEWSQPDRDDSGDARTNKIFAVRRGRYKLINNPKELRPWNPPYERRDRNGFPLEKVELYDLETDPHETRNIAAEHPEIVEELTAVLAEWLEAKILEATSADAMTPEAATELEELGYIGGDKRKKQREAEDGGAGAPRRGAEDTPPPAPGHPSKEDAPGDGAHLFGDEDDC